VPADTRLGSPTLAVAGVSSAMGRQRPYRPSLGLEATVEVPAIDSRDPVRRRPRRRRGRPRRGWDLHPL